MLLHFAPANLDTMVMVAQTKLFATIKLAVLIALAATKEFANVLLVSLETNAMLMTPRPHATLSNSS
jgi:hypothetical protein